MTTEREPRQRTLGGLQRGSRSQSECGLASGSIPGAYCGNVITVRYALYSLWFRPERLRNTIDYQSMCTVHTDHLLVHRRSSKSQPSQHFEPVICMSLSLRLLILVFSVLSGNTKTTPRPRDLESFELRAQPCKATLLVCHWLHWPSARR